MATTGGSTCGRCGEPIAVGAHFCLRCGADVSGAQSHLATSLVGVAPTATQQAAALALLRHATLGEYDIQGELGRGGMATVYLAHDVALNRKVAIKVMSPGLLAGEGMMERFKREARTAASLSHPHIIPIHAVRESEQILFFVMKFVEGRPLDSIIREIGPLPIPMVQTILQQVGGALGYAHRRGVVHRDIKPANIMIDVEGWAVVTDFGIAKVAEAHGLTMTGATVGTPSYMSPEQCAAKPLTGAADQYSLGVVAYEMLAGKPPFVADTALALMYAHATEPPPSITEMRRDCPPELAAAIMRMLEKEPARRWPDMEAAVAAIGGAPLAHDDPIRTRLMTLAATGASAQLAKRASTPLSPTPAVRGPVPKTAGGATLGGKGLTIVPAQVSVAVGGAVQLTVHRKTGGTAGTATLPGHEVTWASTDPEVATVSPNGLVTALRPGRATITALLEATSATAVITVTPARARRRWPLALAGGGAAALLALGVWRFGPWHAARASSPASPPVSGTDTARRAPPAAPARPKPRPGAAAPGAPAGGPPKPSHPAAPPPAVARPEPVPTPPKPTAPSVGERVVNDSLRLDWRVVAGAQVLTEAKGENGLRRAVLVDYSLATTPGGVPTLERHETSVVWQTADILARRRAARWYTDQVRDVISLGDSPGIQSIGQRTSFTNTIPSGTIVLQIGGGTILFDSLGTRRTGEVPRGTLSGEMLGTAIAALPDPLPASAYLWVLDRDGWPANVVPLRVDFGPPASVEVPLARPGTDCAHRLQTSNTKLDAVSMTATVGANRLEWRVLARRPHLTLLNAKCLRLAGPAEP